MWAITPRLSTSMLTHSDRWNDDADWFEWRPSDRLLRVLFHNEPNEELSSSTCNVPCCRECCTEESSGWTIRLFAAVCCFDYHLRFVCCGIRKFIIFEIPHIYILTAMIFLKFYRLQILSGEKIRKIWPRLINENSRNQWPQTSMFILN